MDDKSQPIPEYDQNAPRHTLGEKSRIIMPEEEAWLVCMERIHQLDARIRKLESIIDLRFRGRRDESSGPTIDRRILPKWANKWIAMESDGVWWSSNSTMHINGGHGWACDFMTEGIKVWIPADHAPSWHGDWRDSLTNLEEQPES